MDDDERLPLKLWPCSNGEYLPSPLDDLRREAMRRARDAADIHARRHGWSRRRFLTSAAGMAAGLVALEGAAADRARATGRERGGRFRVDPAVARDQDAACEVVHGPVGTAPVIDVQTHFLENVETFGAGFPQAGCGEDDPGDCFSVDHWYDLVFNQSDTAVAVISAVPVVADPDPLSIDAMERGRALADELCGDGRVLVQGHAVPDVGPIEAVEASMLELASTHALAAWKAYTHAPTGWALDDHDPSAAPIGQRFIEAVRASGVPIVAVHKGLSGGNRWASPSDIGPAAAAHPDLAFCVYHSGYESGTPERAYDADQEASALTGVDRLVRSAADAGIGPGGNVYAELGSTWRIVMGNPDEAAHVLGKLLAAFGPDRILWGTDSIWYGSPQDQIAAFRTFEITPSFQEQYGYPALTDDVKARILSHNAAALYGIDVPSRRCPPVGEEESRSLANATLGPVSRRGVMSTFLREHPWMTAPARMSTDH
ncbi:amidohydrolase family protein [Desertimonas flava]|uniref:amidohydrolase family protein n=1 Tax=Desertimonas flava TaxID=2064846 RepID=UPI0013C4A162|nr:amidohydrolase family protein [Desertimonas flava]